MMITFAEILAFQGYALADLFSAQIGLADLVFDLGCSDQVECFESFPIPSQLLQVN